MICGIWTTCRFEIEKLTTKSADTGVDTILGIFALEAKRVAVAPGQRIWILIGSSFNSNASDSPNCRMSDLELA
jgi:hypothetical protein